MSIIDRIEKEKVLLKIVEIEKKGVPGLLPYQVDKYLKGLRFIVNHKPRKPFPYGMGAEMKRKSKALKRYRDRGGRE